MVFMSQEPHILDNITNSPGKKGTQAPTTTQTQKTRTAAGRSLSLKKSPEEKAKRAARRQRGPAEETLTTASTEEEAEQCKMQ